MTREIKMQLNGVPFLDRAEIAESMLDRMRGLLGRDALLPNHGLLITHCPSIHMVGMRFPIDAIFIANDGEVVRITRDIQPGRLMVSGGSGARLTLEISTGWLDADAIKPGDRITWA